MGNIDYIEYKNATYPTKRVDLRTYGEVLISTTLLNDALFDPAGNYQSDDARYLDEKICYFVMPDEIYLEDELLVSMLENELDIENELD